MDDLGFVQSCIRQDKHAWSEFVERYSRLIYSYIYKILEAKGISPAQDYASDICQEIFHSLIKDDFRKLRTYSAKNGCSLASWLRQVSINAAIDHVRRLKPAVSLEQEQDGRPPLKDVIAAGGVSASEALFDKEKAARLRECIDRLGTDDKYFLELYINRGIKLEKLRVHLRLSRSAIDMRKLRLIGRLKECFKERGFIPTP